MVKFFNQTVLLVILTLIFASCGDDDKGYPPYDPNYIAGNYEGTCTINYGTQKQVDDSFPALFFMNSEAGLGALFGNATTLNEDGLGNYGDIKLSAFESHDSYATFHISRIKATYNVGNIPKFIARQADAFDVKSATLEMVCEQGGQFNPNKQEITFVYKGYIEITGTESYQKFSNAISYSFVLKRKE